MTTRPEATTAANATTPPDATTLPNDPQVAALQAALAGEHAAVWACGRAAGELSGRQRRAALRELDAHRQAREELRRTIDSLGATPVDAAPAYLEPFPVSGAAAARRLLGHVNTGLSATYADLAAASPRAARRPAAMTSAAAAVRAVDWGAAAQAFPGAG
jgi:hypothetical protein